MNRAVQRRRHAVPWLCIVMGLLMLVNAATAQESAAQRERLTLEEHVQPILQSRCIRCHGADTRESGLDLRRRFTMVAGGDSGPAIVPHDPDSSLLMEYIDDGVMPPDDEPQLRVDEIDLLRQWIAAGAATVSDTEPPLPASSEMGDVADETVRQHWSFQPIQSPVVPHVKHANRVRTPVDAFILAQQEQRGWRPAEPASKRTLLRRLYFDLTGLPPTPEDVAAFLNDSSSDAYEQIVDRLLGSTHYGERWAQHWLDVVRFAETEGFEYDRHLPDAWRFRDYVIDAFNNDKPFDQFVSEQIAGDELDPDSYEHQCASIFHRLGAVRRNAGNPEIALSRNEVLTERTNIIGEAFLGLTVGCARCHNHKLEPITQKDYYRLQAYFAATQEHNFSLAAAAEQAAWESETEAITEQIDELKERIAAVSGDEETELRQKIELLQQQLPAHLPTVPGTRNDPDRRTKIHVLRRGVWELKGVPVGPRPLSILLTSAVPELPADVDTPRTRLAEWLTDETHPLTARVIVNRIWQYHFGAGLVTTANDFGLQGSRPSHPELLDWLAHELISNGWRLKSLHRQIVLSNTYRQGGRGAADDVALTDDPDNRFLARFSRRRLSGEELRDAMLAVSGLLNSKLHGPSVMTAVDDELIGLLYDPDQWQVSADASEHHRRSIYLIAKRNLRLPFMEAFDAPALQTSCPVRAASTHAPQALELLNGRFANEMAAAFAARLQRECGDDVERIVECAWQLATGHPPTPRQRDLSLAFLRDQPLREFALAIFNLNEFVYVE